MSEDQKEKKKKSLEQGLAKEQDKGKMEGTLIEKMNWELFGYGAKRTRRRDP